MTILRFFLFVPLVLLGIVAGVIAVSVLSIWMGLAALVILATAVAVLQTEVGIVLGVVLLPLLMAVVLFLGRSVTFAH